MRSPKVSPEKKGSGKGREVANRKQDNRKEKRNARSPSRNRNEKETEKPPKKKRKLSPKKSASELVQSSGVAPKHEQNETDADKELVCLEEASTSFEELRKSPKKTDAEGNEIEGTECDVPLNANIQLGMFKDSVLAIPNSKKGIKVLETHYGEFGIVSGIHDKKKCIVMYEHVEAECQRFQTQLGIVVKAAAHGKNHFLRILANTRIGMYSIVVFKEIGPFLSDLWRRNRFVFSPATAVRVALYTLKAVEELHSLGFIHRDLKPSVFALCASGCSKTVVYMVHAGLARRFVKGNGELRPRRQKVVFLGALRYASRAAHLKEERCRRDDLESWLYMFVDFLGDFVLPWAKQTNRNGVLNEKERFLSDDGVEAAMRINALIPNMTKLVVSFIRHLKYDSTVDYNYVKDLLTSEIKKNNYNDDRFDWEAPTTPSSNPPTSTTKTNSKTTA
ncbi:hypothetical protein QR680_016562 [Steinernema hermaphroditum]|uniref:Protein kinase domain-containing protein n=1 Tax=Steinernema hermaphroditum TaxID=289476 RepID=A0AA39HBK8_9BILA|nr:hypothetical protein QR680_016562 [Steinernema hermaphroditum]